MPFMPGTFGTFMAIPLYLVLVKLPLPLYGLATLIYSLAAMWACDKTAKDWGVADPGAAASDEVAGFLVALCGLTPSVSTICVAFVIFRILDIWKPFPITWFDRNVHGGIGIVLDDLIAGAATCVITGSIFKFLV